MGLDPRERSRRRHDGRVPVDLQGRLVGHLPATSVLPPAAHDGRPWAIVRSSASGAASARTVDDLRGAMATRAAYATLEARRRIRRVVAALLASLLGLGGLALPAGAAQGRFDATDAVPDSAVLLADLVKSQDDDAYTQGA